MIKTVRPCYGESTYNRRIEVTLTNGQSFTVFINEDGTVKLLSDTPHALGGQVISGVGNVIPVNYYGYPSD